MASMFSNVSNRLTAKLHRIFARAIRAEAASRKKSYRIGPFPRDRKIIEGWNEVADWLEGRAYRYESKADLNNEPRF